MFPLSPKNLDEDKELDNAISELENAIRWFFTVYATRGGNDRWDNKEDWAKVLTPFCEYRTETVSLSVCDYFISGTIDSIIFFLDRCNLRTFFKKRKCAIRKILMSLLKRI